MKNIEKVIVILFFMMIGMVYGQKESKYFYYYKDKKYYLQLDKSSIAISSGTKNVENLFKAKTKLVESFTRKSVSTTDRKALENKDNKTFYIEIDSDKNRTDEEYMADLKEKNASSDVLVASPCFITEEGQKIGMSNNFYIKLKSKDGIKVLYELAQKNNVEVLGYNEFMPLWFTLACTKRSTLPNAMDLSKLFYETGYFESAEPEFIYHNLEATADPYFPNQWSLKNTGQYGALYAGIDIKAEQAWSLATGTNIKTAIFDHGFEMNHPDLMANVFGTGFDAQTNSSPSVVRGSHGTACAGITGAVQNNNLGISGVAPDTKLVSISISLYFSDTPQQLANGFNWASANGVDVISNSWGGYAPSSIIDNAISNALLYGRGGKGMVIVFAAGNENNTNIRYPGNSNPQILVVGAMSPCGERKNPGSCDGENWWGGCYGNQLDVVAPGVKMPTTDRQGSNGYDASDYTQIFNGTSSACPVVAGVAALILSKNPGLTVQQVNDIIEQSAQKVRTDKYAYTTTSGRPNGTWHLEMGYGLVNAYQALLITPPAGPCPASLTITTNVTGTDNQEASSNITAVNTINSGATAVYHAGGEVLLQDGFTAVSGSVFRGYIEGCTGNYIARNQSGPEKITYDEVVIKEDLSNSGVSAIEVFPNPNEGVFELRVNHKIKNYSVSIYSTSSREVFTRKNVAENMIKIDIRNQLSGIYIVRIIDHNGKIYTEKLIKK